MKLCDRDIETWLNSGKLIISPFPSIEMINGATVDVRLGNYFRIFNNYNSGIFIDLKQSEENISKVLNELISDEIYISNDEKFFLHPKTLVLSITLESITLPNNLIGWLSGRSSLARLGLMIHVTAHKIDPGWRGKIVLEFYNFSKFTLILHPGMLIGALSFELLTNPSVRPYNMRKNAKFYNQKNISLNKICKN